MPIFNITHECGQGALICTYYESKQIRWTCVEFIQLTQEGSQLLRERERELLYFQIKIAPPPPFHTTNKKGNQLSWPLLDLTSYNSNSKLINVSDHILLPDFPHITSQDTHREQGGSNPAVYRRVWDNWFNRLGVIDGRIDVQRFVKLQNYSKSKLLINESYFWVYSFC